MRRIPSLVFLASILAVGPLTWASEPAPVAIPTEDGLTLRGRHYPALEADAVPVILFHGLGANGRCFDFPAPFPSLARYLQGEGWDVWVVNLRCHGRGPWRSDGDFSHGFDEFAIYDVEATVAAVEATTQKRPFLIGHSMGGMVTLAWLQGAHFEEVVLPRRGWLGRIRSKERVLRVTGAMATAKARQARIRGAVLLGSPPFVGWPGAPRAVSPDSDAYYDFNLLVEVAARHPISWRTRVGPDEIHLEQVTSFLAEDIRTVPVVGRRLQRATHEGARAFGHSVFATYIVNPANYPHDLTVEALGIGLDSVSTRVLGQFLDSVRTGRFREQHTRDRGRQPYVYSDHFDRILVPALVVAGNRDKLVPDEHVKAHLHDRLGSTDRTYLLLDGYGHADMIIGRQAEQDLFQPLATWLAARR